MSTEPDPEPLDDIQEAVMRDLVSEKAASGGTMAAKNAARIFATLDRERATPSSVTPDLRAIEAGSESVSANGADVRQPDGPVVDEPAATDSDPLERARGLIEAIHAASGELSTLYGPLWHRLAALASVTPSDPTPREEQHP